MASFFLKSNLISFLAWKLPEVLGSLMQLLSSLSDPPTLVPTETSKVLASGDPSGLKFLLLYPTLVISPSCPSGNACFPEQEQDFGSLCWCSTPTPALLPTFEKPLHPFCLSLPILPGHPASSIQGIRLSKEWLPIRSGFLRGQTENTKITQQSPYYMPGSLGLPAYSVM